MAQSAIGASYAQPVSLLQQTHTQTQVPAAFQRPAGNFLGQSPRTIQSSETPSLSDINTLESSLQRAESQVSQLLTSPAKNPALQATINTKISNLQFRISELKSAITKAKADYASYQKAAATLSNALATLNSTTSNKEAALAAYNLAAQQQAEALANKESALAARNLAAQELQTASDELALKQASTNTKLQNLNLAATNKALKEQALAQKTALLQDANAALAEAQTQYTLALEAKNSALTSLNTAQSNYDTSSIPDPTWTAPTYQQEHIRTITNTRQVEVRTQVPRTETVFQEQVLSNLLFNSDFSRGNEGWSGLSIGWQNSQPGYFNGNIVFSYMNQTVSQGLFSGPFNNATLTLSADWFNNESNRGIVDSYSMTVEAKDINQNPVGSATYTSTGAHDWENKSVTLTATGPVSYVTVSFSGIDNGYWAGNYGPRLKNLALNVTHGEFVTQTVYDEVITYEEETYYTYETYYTTETVQPQTGLTVKVYNGLNSNNPQRSDTAYNLCLTTNLTKIEANWGGGNILGCGNDRVMIHYTGYITPTETITSLRNIADDGFYMDVNGTNVINNWTLKGCGGNWNPVTLEAGKTYAIDAWFYEWGGGACSTLYYQSSNGSGVIPEAWYTNAISAPLIKDPALKTILDTAEDVFQTKSDDFSLVEQSLSASEGTLTSATLDHDTADSELTTATTDVDAAQSEYDFSTTELSTATTSKTQVETQKAAADDNLVIAETAATQVASVVTETNTNLQTAEAASVSATTTFAEAETAHTEAVSSYQSSVLTAKTTSTQLPTETEIAEVSTLIEEPVPTPPVEEGSKEIPAELSAENLMSVDLTKVDPTELTAAQADQLVTAALETFETATEGSPEYQQALGALYLAAQQDDIVLDPALAAIPGLQAAAELINFFGNAGADMSPKKRAESKKIVVTAVVAVGAAVASATGAATSAASSSSSSSSGSGSSRRKQ